MLSKSRLTADTENIANTDGANTIRSSNISFSNWIVYNGDDSLSLKGNSTEISIRDCLFSGGLGIAIGSIGQYNGEYEVIQGVTVDNITYNNTLHAVRSAFFLIVRLMSGREISCMLTQNNE